MTSIIGFTGRSTPVPTPQRYGCEDLLEWLRDSGATHLVHGDCIEADSMAHLQAQDLGLEVVLRPGCGLDGESPKRAWNDRASFVYPTAPYMTRNLAIVSEADLLVAVPSTFAETVRGGEWATVRMARRVGVPVVIVWPDGTVEEDPGPKEF